MQYLPRRAEIDRLRAVLRAGVYTSDRVRASMREHPYAPYTACIAGVDRERVRRLTLRMKRLEALCRATEKHVEDVRAYDWLCDFIACNPSRFNPNSFGDYSGECWGTVDESAGKAYIIKGVFDRIMTDAGFNPASFLSWADRKGRIERQGGKRTKVKRLNGTITRCVVLDVISGFNDENSTIETDSEVLEQFQQMECGR